MRFIERERMQLLGLDRRSQPGIFHEESLRLSNDAEQQETINPRYAFGVNTASKVLPALGLTFKDLRESAQRHGKPILDVGSSYSTVACESHLRGIPIFSTDLGCDTNRGNFLENVSRNLYRLRELYMSGAHPPGHELAEIPAERWDREFDAAIATLNAQLTQCSAQEIRLPDGRQASDRHFSIVYSHHAIPQYSTPEKFLRNELPELLRITADRLILYPFQLGDHPFNRAYEGDVAFLTTVQATASDAGFDFTLEPSPSSEFPNAIRARFSRRVA